MNGRHGRGGPLDDTPAPQLAGVTAEPLLQRLQAVSRAAKGWRAVCPVCGGRSSKLVVAEVPERVLLHCFGGCPPAEIIAAVGLRWADLFPPRQWPISPEQRRHATRAIREIAWRAALDELVREATIALVAARKLHACWALSEADDARLALAVERLHHAKGVLGA